MPGRFPSWAVRSCGDLYDHPARGCTQLREVRTPRGAFAGCRPNGATCRQRPGAEVLLAMEKVSRELPLWGLNGWSQEEVRAQMLERMESGN